LKKVAFLRYGGSLMGYFSIYMYIYKFKELI
jgi:hypothetical protein